MKRFLVGLGILAAAASAYALEFKTREASGVQMLYSAKSSAATSTHTFTGYGLAWSVSVVGGTADFHIKHSTIAGASVEVNKSSMVYLPSGGSIEDEFLGQVYNPVLVIDRLDQPGATVYIDISYLKRRGPGSF